MCNLFISFITFFSNLIIFDVGPKNLLKYYTIAGPFYKYFISVYIFEIILAHIILLEINKSLGQQDKLKVKYFVLAIIVSVMVGSFGFVTTYLDFFLPEIGSIGATIYAVIIAYAILKHRLPLSSKKVLFIRSLSGCLPVST